VSSGSLYASILNSGDDIVAFNGGCPMFQNIDDEPLKVVPSKQNRKNFECTPH
jgi:hypothetical protein